MTVKLLTDPHLRFLTLKGGRTGSCESTLVKCQIVGNLMPRLISVSLVLNYKLYIHVRDRFTKKQTV